MNLYEFHNKPEELNGYEDRIYFIPEFAYNTLSENPNREDKNRLEDCIAKSGTYSCQYAYYVLNKPFPNGEDAIANSTPDTACFYATKVLKGKFPKGEKLISMSRKYWDEYEFWTNEENRKRYSVK